MEISKAPVDATPTIAIATFGSRDWENMALGRALPSALAQGVPVVHAHEPGLTLAQVRNAALAKVETDYVIFLDGDDELAPGYVDAMLKGSAMIRGPSLEQRFDRRLQRRGHTEVHRLGVPKVWAHEHVCTAECLRKGNWLVIGSMAHVGLMREVGGWQEEGWSEDWSMWARMWVAGATVEAIPDAWYIAHRRANSRNRIPRRETVRWHHIIEDSIWPSS